MATSIIQECCDCGEPFCTACDAGCGHCADCGGQLCEGCAELALDTRNMRCYSCDDPDLATVQFPYSDGRKIYRKYSTVRKGKAD